MKFTPSQLCSMIARAAKKELTWRFYIRHTDSLNGAVTGLTGWTEITSRVVEVPAQSSKIEYEIGQFTSDGIPLKCRDLVWIRENVFSSSHKYTELKVTCTLSIGVLVATDEIIAFSGFIEPTPPVYSEASDEVEFKVRTAQDQASTIAAETITTQYIATISGTDYLLSQTIDGLFIKDGSSLQLGTHTITLKYDAGDHLLSLDGGDDVTLAAGDNTVTDKKGVRATFNSLVVHVPVLADLPILNNEISDTLIVTEQGETLPRQWYFYAQVRKLLTKIILTMGAVPSIDALTLASFDGGLRFAYVDLPPENETAYGDGFPQVADASGDLWMIMGALQLYKRNRTDGTYALANDLSGHIATLGSSDAKKMFYNARNGDLIIYVHRALPDPGGIIKYHIADGSSFAHVLSVALGDGATSDIHEITNRIGVVDYNYSGSSWHYSFIYAVYSPGELREYDFLGVTDSRITFLEDLPPLANNTCESILYSRYLSNPERGNPYWGTVAKVAAGAEWDVLEIHLDSSNVWTWPVDARLLTNVPGVDDGSGLRAYSVCGFLESEDRIYFYSPNNQAVQCHTLLSTIPTTVVDFGDYMTDVTGESVQIIQKVGSSLYFTLMKTGFIAKASAGAGSIVHGFDAINPSNDAQPQIKVGSWSWTGYGTAIYGITDFGRLFILDSNIELYCANADFTGKNIQEVWNGLLASFMLIGNVNSFKSAKVKWRCDASGNPYTTGNSITLTVDEASDLVQETTYPAYPWVSVSNGKITHSYDGVNFDQAALSTTRKVELTNTFLPDELVKDFCYRAYQFFAVERVGYKVRAGIMPEFQWEPMDGATLSLAGTKIGADGSGIIYGVMIEADGSLELEVNV